MLTLPYTAAPGITLTLQGSNTMAGDGWTDLARSSDGAPYQVLDGRFTADLSTSPQHPELNSVRLIQSATSSAPAFQFYRLKADRN